MRVLQISAPTAKRDRIYARAWLFRHITEESQNGRATAIPPAPPANAAQG